MNGLLLQQKDNIALIDRVLNDEDKLFECKEELQDVEDFFKNQVQIFDVAAQLEESLRNELDYMSHEKEANEALNKIRLITGIQGGFDYKKIPGLTALMKTVHDGQTGSWQLNEMRYGSSHSMQGGHSSGGW